jgi:formylmethanofuran dehydrogenase subunit C
VSDGIGARLRKPLEARADLGAVLAGSWSGLTAAEVARRPVPLDGGPSVPLGDLFEVAGRPAGRIRFEGDLTRADRLGAGLTEGEVIVDGGVGDETGIGMSGGVIDVLGDAGARVGGAEGDARRGMTGGELLVRGNTGPEPGTRMRRGLVVVMGDVAARAGPGMIAGTVIVFGNAGPAVGRWSKRGSIVALGPVEIPPTYRYACTYQPDHLRLTLLRLRQRYDLAVDERCISGFYRRYSGDLADLGRGEILAWTAD